MRAPNAEGAATAIIIPSADNTIYESAPPFDFGSAELNRSNGAGSYLFAGRTAPTNNGLGRRALIRFDLAGQIPAGSTVVGATLRLYLSQTITSPVVATMISLHRLNAGWGEGASDASGQEGGGANATPGDATWLHSEFGGELWDSPGGDFADAASAASLVGDRNQFYDWAGPQMVSDAQDWLDDPASNFGWIIIGDESGPATAKRFDSRDSFSFDLASNERTIPVLTIAYIPEPSGAMLAALGAAIPLFRRRVGSAAGWMRR
ncbi:MAG: DNRLRE domain-containing protein [Verrucomicrobiales bacterium]